MEVMESFQKLHRIAMDNSVSFEELCVYALGTLQSRGSESTEGSTAESVSGKAPGSSESSKADSS